MLLLSQSLSIKGIVKGIYFEGYTIDKESNPNITVSNLKRNSWQEGSNYKYQITFTVKNISNEVLDNYKLILTFNSPIIDVSIWNHNYEIDDRKLIVKSQNQLAVNQNIEVSLLLPWGINNLFSKNQNRNITTTEEIDEIYF